MLKKVLYRYKDSADRECFEIFLEQKQEEFSSIYPIIRLGESNNLYREYGTHALESIQKDDSFKQVTDSWLSHYLEIKALLK